MAGGSQFEETAAHRAIALSEFSDERGPVSRRAGRRGAGLHSRVAVTDWVDAGTARG